LATNKMY